MAIKSKVNWLVNLNSLDLFLMPQNENCEPFAPSVNFRDSVCALHNDGNVRPYCSTLDIFFLFTHFCRQSQYSQPHSIVSGFDKGDTDLLKGPPNMMIHSMDMLSNDLIGH